MGEAEAQAAASELGKSNQVLAGFLALAESSETQAYFEDARFDRTPWDLSDFLVAFGAGLTGTITALWLRSPGRFVPETPSEDGDLPPGWMEGLARRAAKSVELSVDKVTPADKDWFASLEGISQFREARFVGTYKRGGIRYRVEPIMDRYGHVYKPPNIGDGVIAWATHAAADFFAQGRLPIPNFAWVEGRSKRELREYIRHQLYWEGNELWTGVTAMIPAIMVEVGVRAYLALRYREQGVPEDLLKQKCAEMFTLAHALTQCVNSKRIVLMGEPTAIHVSTLVAVMKSLATLVLLENPAHHFVQRFVERRCEQLRTGAEMKAWLEQALTEPVVLG